MKKALLALVTISASTCLFAGQGTGKLLIEAYSEYPLKNTPEAAIYRGGIVFNHYCALCHGVAADGRGRAAKMYDPKPANLILSDKNDSYKELIIRRGGEELGRSQFMPPWDAELTDEQVSDVVSFLRSIQVKKP